jgi:hypothetical protein
MKLRIAILVLIISTPFARRLIEPDDIQPILSLRSVTALEISDQYFYAGVDGGVLRFERFQDFIDLSKWETFNVPGTVRRIQRMGDYIYVVSSSGNFLRRERDIFDIQFQPVDTILRLPPNVRICDPYNLGVSLPFRLFWENSDSILGPDLFFYRITDCVSDGSFYLYFSTDGLGIFRADLRMKLAEPLNYGPCCDNSDAVFVAGDSIFFGGCSDIEFCAFSIATDNMTNFEWITGDRSAAFPSYGPVLDFAKHGDELYIATPRGLALFDFRHSHWQRPTAQGSVPLSSANALVIHDSTLYIASDDGVFSLDLSTKTLRHLTPIDLRYFADIDYALGKIIAVGDFGAYQLIDTSFLPLKPPDGHLDLDVRSIKPFVSSEAVFATPYAIIILEDSGTRQFLPSSIYFGSAEIFDIEPTRKYLWVATDRGLFVYDRLRKISTRLDKDFHFPEFAVYKLFLQGDYLWMTTDRGLYRYFWNEPDRIYR